MQQVHDIFGESWKVSDQRDWLFSTQEFINAIRQDIEDDFGFLPSYEINFASEDFRNQANIVSCLVKQELRNIVMISIFRSEQMINRQNA